MSQACPDWRTLSAHRHERETAGTPEPAGWGDALAHFDACPACRREALAADPTLLFRRLPAPLADSFAESAEVDAMLKAVATMRTMERVEEARAAAPSRWRWLAAAVLALAALALSPNPALRGVPVALAVLAPEAPPGRSILPAAAHLSGSPALMAPMVEDLNRPAARVYQMDGGGDLSVVMIVDERFDV